MQPDFPHSTWSSLWHPVRWYFPTMQGPLVIWWTPCSSASPLHLWRVLVVRKLLLTLSLHAFVAPCLPRRLCQSSHESYWSYLNIVAECPSKAFSCVGSKLLDWKSQVSCRLAAPFWTLLGWSVPWGFLKMKPSRTALLFWACHTFCHLLSVLTFSDLG